MAKYTYQCQACQYQFDTEHSMKQDPLKECPECKELQLERLIVKTNFVLNGQGWAKDGYSSIKK